MARSWRLLADVNRLALFRTCGCTALGKTPGGHEAPFVDISFTDLSLATSESTHERLQSQLLTLDGVDVAQSFTLELCKSDATLPDNSEILSTRLWFLGERGDAERVFPVIVEALSKLSVADYQGLRELDEQRNSQNEGCAKIASVPIFAVILIASVIDIIWRGGKGWRLRKER